MHLATDSKQSCPNIGPDRPHISSETSDACLAGITKQGALAQLGERLICIQEVRSSILLGSTTLQMAREITGR